MLKLKRIQTGLAALLCAAAAGTARANYPGSGAVGSLGELSPAAASFAVARGGSIGVAVYNDKTGKTYLQNGSWGVRVASTAKVGIMAAVIAKAQREGRGVNAWEQGQLWSMITQSDNDVATNLWRNYIGPDNVRSYLRSIGSNLAPDNESPTSWGYSWATPHDLMKLVARIQYGGLWSADKHAYALWLMRNVTSWQAFMRGGLPAGTNEAEKCGWYNEPETGTWRVHSVAAVNAGGSSYTIAVMTRYPAGWGMNYGIDTIRGVAARIHAAFLASGTAGGGGFQAAFQANTSSLWTVGSAGNRDWSLGMRAGTSPSVAALSGGGFQAAFQANTSALWTVGSLGHRNWGLGMAAGTSPSITGLTGGGFQVAFQANTGNLWTVGNAGMRDWKLGMKAGTSPSITALPGGGFQVAFQANTSNLWTVGSAGMRDWKLGMMAGSSPSITTLTNGGFQVAFQANTSNLWTVGSAGMTDWRLGMRAGTSPSIAGLSGGGFQVAFQANTSALWTCGAAGHKNWGLGMAPGTSPAIAGLSGGGFEVAFQANTSALWTVGSAGNRDWKLGMRGGTSPAIAGLR